MQRFNPETPENWPLPSENLLAIERLLKEGVQNTVYRERLEQRRQELIARRTQREAGNTKTINTAAEEQAAEMFIIIIRGENLDMIRNGEAGLGIPLTPEEKAMLIAEGLQPPDTETQP